MNERPSRPLSDRPERLGFIPQKRMVPWLSPPQLVGTGLRVLLSAIFGAYSDKRELQACLEAVLPPPGYGKPGEDLWIDFVADLGDAFEPTYSIASLLAGETLEVGRPGGGSVTTHRGQVLIMGGDEVYPAPSIAGYENQLVGPYRAALPFTDPPDHPDLYATPGNHDWYDGLTAFMRVFCRGEWIGGWRTPQTRSYFALQLPQRWWLWGIDIQFKSYIDDPQFRYFKEVAETHLRANDSIILCSAVPSWVHANFHEPEGYVALDYFERRVIRAHDAVVRLSLTGDAHHYARYAASDSTGRDQGNQKITAGGGGTYLSATHHLPETLELPPRASRDPGKTTPPSYFQLETTYPTKAVSKRLRFGVIDLPLQNPGFWALIGSIYFLYAWMLRIAPRPGGQFFADLSLADLAWRVVHTPLAFLLTVVVVWGAMGFTRSNVWWKRALGALHGLAHVGLAIIVTGVAATALSGAEGGWLFIGLLVFVGGIGGLLGSWLMALYLLLADTIECNTNELFAAQRIRDYKNFLRLHLDTNGTLTVYPIKVERTPRHFRLRQDSEPPEHPWFEPANGSIEAELIEAPIHIRPLAGSQSGSSSDSERGSDARSPRG